MKSNLLHLICVILLIRIKFSDCVKCFDCKTGPSAELQYCLTGQCTGTFCSSSACTNMDNKEISYSRTCAKNATSKTASIRGEGSQLCQDFICDTDNCTESAFTGGASVKSCHKCTGLNDCQGSTECDAGFEGCLTMSCTQNGNTLVSKSCYPVATNNCVYFTKSGIPCKACVCTGDDCNGSAQPSNIPHGGAGSRSSISASGKFGIIFGAVIVARRLA